MTDHLDGMPEAEGYCESATPADMVETKAEAAADAFLESFEAFKADMSGKMSSLDERLGSLQTKAAMRRPALSTRAEREAPYQKAFGAFLRHGEEDSLRAMNLEAKGINTQTGSEGGHLVDPRTSEMVSKVLRGGGSLRSISRVVQVEATAYDVIIDRAELQAGWLDEVTPATETTGPIFERISITLHELSANPRASQRILEDTAFDLEAWLAERIGDRFRRAEATAFVNGSGGTQPMGFMQKDRAPNGSEVWGEIGYVATGTLGGFDLNDPGDAIVDLAYALGADYRQNGTFVMNSKTAGEVRK
ncbi:MAG: phage major capsid protein, partial [Pseudomonadota bacterium]